MSLYVFFGYYTHVFQLASKIACTQFFRGHFKMYPLKDLRNSGPYCDTCNRLLAMRGQHKGAENLPKPDRRGFL